ncbi:MAG TPA: hypothetical protein DHW82_12875 [Spirochaetia bacterium]|nr:MAG: hypothetical protein A2Y41_03335 [Spirochaetes bacterium GWB1_36_13]HCL57883.1 hypothetical protein [Spirochaetia bacterium]
MKKSFHAAVLSGQALTVMAGASIAPALGGLKNFFSSYESHTVQLIISLPALFILLTTLFQGFLLGHWSKRKLLLTGIVLYILGGTAGGFASYFPEMLIYRAILGIAVGLIMPASLSLIAESYQNEERKKMMGLSSSVSNIGGLTGTLFAGFLAGFCWRYAFAVYLLALPVWYLIFKNIQDKVVLASSLETVKKTLFPKKAYFYGVCAMVFMASFYLLPTNMALLIQKENLGEAGITGLILSLLTFTVFLSGFYFQKLSAKIHLLPVYAFIFFIAGFIFFSFSKTLVMIFVSVSLIGIGMGFIFPFIFHEASLLAHGKEGHKVMNLITGSLFAGQFLSPVFFGVLNQLFFKENTRFLFLSAGIGLGLFGLLIFMMIRMKFFGNPFKLKIDGNSYSSTKA